MSNIKLGTIPSAPGNRDAVHVAIVSVFADEDLDPGQVVTLIGENKVRAIQHNESNVNPIGVVDPFLKETVYAGSYFWLCLYPMTVSDMTHVWSHPMFDSYKAQSEFWLREKAERVEVTYEEMMEAALHGCTFGHDIMGETEIEPEFWMHYKNVTGKEILNKETFFSCAC